MMRKKLLSSEQKRMPGRVYVQAAANWAEALTNAESRRPGDYDNAMRRVSKRVGVGYSTLWGLRYRRPKRVFTEIYFALATAHEAMCDRQAQRYLDARAATDTSDPMAAALTRIAGAIAGELDQPSLSERREGDL